MFDKPDFEMAQNRATKFLLDHTITGLSFDPRSLDLTSEGIVIDTVENYARLTRENVNCFVGRNIKGCYVLKARGYQIILYQSSLVDPDERKIYGITHELGHIYCEHKCDDDIQEIEANFFAAQVLMPEIVVYHIRDNYKNCHINAHDLVKLFNVSYEAASRRIKTFNKKVFCYASEIDYQLLQKYKPYIDEYFNDRDKSKKDNTSIKYTAVF